MALNTKTKNETSPFFLKNAVKYIIENKAAYFFVLPFAVIFIIFTILPVINAIFFSFTSFNVLEPPKWVGWRNYIRLFTADNVFIIAVKNTLIFAAITGPVSYLLSLLFAWFLNEMAPKTRSILTLLFYAPALSNIFVIWKFIFSGDSYGIVNAYLIKLGFILEPIQFFTDQNYMVNIIILIVLWSSLGTSFLAFIAGFQTIDKSLFEAGAVDGIKNRWQELWFITLPTMRQQLLFGAVMSITASFGIGATITQLVGFPSTNYAAHTIINHLEDYGGIRFEMGYACAIATILFLLMVLSNNIVQKVLHKVGG